MKLIFSNVLRFNPRIEYAFEKLNQLNPDILVIAEFPTHKSKRILPILSSYPYQQIFTPKKPGSLAIFSKYKISNVEHINQEVFQSKPQASMNIDYKTGFKLYTIHTPAPYSYRNYRNRNKQILQLTEDLKQENQPMIIVGDFNASHRRWEMKQFKEELNLSECRNGYLVKPTWPIGPKFWCLDHIFYSKEFELLDFKRLKFIYSDHLPIAAEFNFSAS